MSSSVQQSESGIWLGRSCSGDERRLSTISRTSNLEVSWPVPKNRKLLMLARTLLDPCREDADVFYK
jgi:hypothetical protein